MKYQLTVNIEAKSKNNLPTSKLSYDRVQQEITNLHAVLDTLNEHLYPFPTGQVITCGEGQAIRRYVFSKLRNLEQLLYKIQELHEGDENNGR